MNIEKIRNLGPEELSQQQREAADQLFRLKFQLKMGQTTGVKKMRELRKDLARIKTIARERELGIANTAAVNTPTPAAGAVDTKQQPAAAAPAKRQSKPSRAVAKKKSAAKKRASAAPKKQKQKTVAKKKAKAKK